MKANRFFLSLIVYVPFMDFIVKANSCSKWKLEPIHCMKCHLNHSRIWNLTKIINCFSFLSAGIKLGIEFVCFVLCCRIQSSKRFSTEFRKLNRMIHFKNHCVNVWLKFCKTCQHMQTCDSDVKRNFYFVLLLLLLSFDFERNSTREH